MPDLNQRLQAAVEKRDRLASEAQRIAGRKEAAEKTLQDVRAEIKSKNLDPDTLDKTIAALESSYEEAVKKLEDEVDAAQQALSPYLENQAP